ncbi:cupin domain-containing protein [Aurantiacibacter sp. MUD11]|uniref:cupin domain-containing protein n=1 Tax=Aurantiacibacter sp. MUD11 TaxID=3003265 RepID=UPI0022AB4CD8|nr:cupin domain-containing protein [Aurantiacibacter sp. MUD11]WAT17304.1 cupin domain-containing protein [Aurantiacibacter sp. MUD11]
MRGAAASLLLVLLAGCASTPAPEARWLPPLGANPVFDATPGAAPRQRLMVRDLRLPPDAVGATHYHPWEEYLYVIEGSAVLEMAGQERRTLLPGESFVIPARQVHTPIAGPEGVRAIVTRVHDADDPERVEVE